MTEERFRRLQSAFDFAVHLDAESRVRYVDEVCADDADLRDELEALLGVDGLAGDLLESGIQGEAFDLSNTRGANLVGERIGIYRLLELVGRGGVGSVYRALREDGVYEKPVALKLIKRGMDTDEILRRFSQERRILSRLDHPNIARLLDGGVTRNGVPYLVMEFVAGEPVTGYGRHASLRDRLTIFLQVCHAVEYAHKNLVVHRDIKPANILVAPDGAPKLLDFGIAKLLTPDESQTATEWLMLTPEYASPEQKRGDPVTIATDIYSLGRVLHELLRDDDKNADELRNIAAMACREEPDRRYASVADFSADIRRHLEGRPVHARKATFFYRAAKFTARNRVTVALAAIAVISVAVLAMLAANRAHEMRDEVEQVRTLAGRILFEMNEELRALPGSIQAREKLVRTGLAYLDAAAVKTRSDARLEWTLAQAYEKIGNIQGGPDEWQSNLGDLDGARNSYERALALTRRLQSSEQRPEYLALEARLLDSAGRLARNPDEAIAHVTASIRIRNAIGDTTGLEQANLSLALARLYAGRPSAAVQALPRKTVQSTWRVKALVLKASGDLPAALETARTGAELSEAYLSSARQAMTRRFAQASLAMARAICGEVLGDPFYLNLGKRKAAIRELRIAARAAEDNAALEPGDAVMLSDLASILLRLADVISDESPAEAVATYERVIAASGRPARRDLLRHELTDPLVAAHTRISYPLRRLGRTDEALRHIRRSLTLEETAAGHEALGDLLLTQGDSAGALASYRSALAVAERQVHDKPDMPAFRLDVGNAAGRIARAMTNMGRTPDASSPGAESRQH